VQVHLVLGSNIEPREENLAGALRRIRALPSLKVVGVSRIYETAAVDLEEDDPLPFLNLAVLVQTSIALQDLLKRLQGIEEELGRRPEDRSKRRSRPIDIDIVLASRKVVDEPDLKVPHPGLPERSFFLWPLVEISPNAVDPLTGTPLRHFLLSAHPPILNTLPPPEAL